MTCPAPSTEAADSVQPDSGALMESIRWVLGRWPGYTGLPQRVRESEDESEYVDGRDLLRGNEVALADLDALSARLAEAEAERDRLEQNVIDCNERSRNLAEKAVRAEAAERRVADVIYEQAAAPSEDAQTAEGEERR